MELRMLKESPSEVLLIPHRGQGQGGHPRGGRPAAPTAPQLLCGCCTQPWNSLPTSQIHLLCTTLTKVTPKPTPEPKPPLNEPKITPK